MEYLNMLLIHIFYLLYKGKMGEGVKVFIYIGSKIQYDYHCSE